MSAAAKDGIAAAKHKRVSPMWRAKRIVHETDENAFMTSEDVRPVRRGFWRG
jgi:hypothetical protein